MDSYQHGAADAGAAPAVHMKTYTAGEDGSRLAEMAKEFGLENQRRQRQQIRAKRSKKKDPSEDARDIYSRARRTMKQFSQDHSVEVARMRAAYSRERHYSATPQKSQSAYYYGEVEDDTFGPLSSTTDTGGLISRQSPRWISDMPEWMEAIELEEEDLHAHGVGGDLNSSVMGIIKGMVGPAILYLPHGLAKSGYALAIPIMLLATFLFLFSCQCLLDSWRLEHMRLLQQVQEREAATTSQDPFASATAPISRKDVIQEGNEDDDDESRTLLSKGSNLSLVSMASVQIDHHKRTFFLSYPELAYRALGYHFEQLVKLGITLMQSCVCLTYLIFVPQNLSSAVNLLFGIAIAPEWFLIVMIAIQVPMSWIRDIRKLTATNLLANLLILYGLIVCIALALMQALGDASGEDGAPTVSPIATLAGRFQNLQPFGNDWFLFIGTSVFMFEGSITVLVPLQEAVFTEEDREKFPAVNRNTVLCIIAFYVFFSITCWMALGDDVRTVLTTSLPAGAAATTVQLAYSVAVIFTFPLQNYPALEIACRSASSAINNYKSCTSWQERISEAMLHNIVSSILVVLLAIVAVTTMESLDKVVSFLGGLLGCPIAFIFPPLIHLRLAGKAGTLTQGRKIMDILVALMGVVAMVLSTMTTLLTKK